MKISEITPDVVKYIIAPSSNISGEDEEEADIDNPVIVAEKATNRAIAAIALIFIITQFKMCDKNI